MVIALLAGMAGCDMGGDDADKEQDAGQGAEDGKAIEGTFVGRLRGTDALIAVVAAPAQKGQQRREVTVFACDAKDLCEWLTGSATGNEFAVDSTDGDAQARGELTKKGVRGTVELAGGETARYSAQRATAAAGLYTLTVSPKGRVRGASAGGVGLTGRSTLPDPGTGTLKLADGTRLRFVARRRSGGDTPRMKKGEARLIVLGNGRLRGAGSDYYLRSQQ